MALSTMNTTNPSVLLNMESEGVSGQHLDCSTKREKDSNYASGLVLHVLSLTYELRMYFSLNITTPGYLLVGVSITLVTVTRQFAIPQVPTPHIDITHGNCMPLEVPYKNIQA